MSWKGAGAWGAQQAAPAWGNQKGAWGNQQQQWGGAGKGGKAAAATISPAQPAWAKKPISPVAATPAKGAWGGAIAAGGKGAAAGKGAAVGGVNKAAEFKAKVAKMSKELEGIESVTNTTIKSSTIVLENPKATAAALKSSVDSIERQTTKLNEMIKSLAAEGAEARKGGPALLAQASELAKLLTKSRAVWQSATAQIAKLKPKAAKMVQEADQKAKELKDTNAFKVILAKAKGEVTTAENAVAAVTRQATPVVASPPEEGEARDKKVTAIETAAAEAGKKLDAARADIQAKNKDIMAYAPEAKKTSVASLLELQKKITEATKTVNVFKAFKVSLPRLAENQKTITEVTESLNGHEAAIAKASASATGPKDSLDKAKVETIDGHLDPVLKAILEANVSLAKLLKGQGLDAVTQAKVTGLRTKGDELKKKVVAVTDKVKGPRDAIKSEEGIDAARALVAKVDEAWKECQEAEMPFLMGVEVLEAETNEAALEACKTAADATSKALAAARSHTQGKLNESKTYEKELATSTAADLGPMLKDLVAIEAKFGKYRKELNERKILPMLSEGLDAISTFDKNAKAAEASTKALSAADFEEQSDKSITDAVEAAKKAVTEASDALTQAQKLSRAGHNKAKANNQHPTILSMNSDLQKGADSLSKLRASLHKGESLVRTKKAISQGEEKVKEGEDAVAKLKKSVPKADFTKDDVASVDEAVKAANSVIRLAGGIIQPVIGAATPKAKEALTKLNERRAAAQTAVTEVITTTKERREEALVSHSLAEAEVKTKATETAAAKMEESESPFLIGGEIDSAKTNDLLAKCAEAGTAVQAALTDSRNFNVQKQNESKGFGEAGAKKLKEGLGEMFKRTTKVGTKLTAFQKDSKDRTKEARMVEASEKADELEASVKKTVAASEPFSKEGVTVETLSEADGEKPLTAFMDSNKDSQAKVNALTSFLQQRQGEQGGNKENLETLKSIRERVTKCQTEMQEKKKATAPFEKRALGKRLLAEAKEQVGGLAAEVKKATDACTALLEEGGEQFLIGNSIQSLAAALQKHMKEKELTIDAVFKAIAKGKAVNEKAFVKYLTELPEAIGHDELSAFSDERRAAMYKRLASSKGVSESDFAGIFKQEANCVRPQALTNTFEVEGSETVCKVEANTTVELFGLSRSGDAGLVRAECKVGDKSGWITVRQGAPLCVPISAFKTFITGMDKALLEGGAAVQKVSGNLSAKLKQGGPAEEGPLKEAREEMAKLKEEVTKSLKAMDELRTKVANGKRTFSGKEASEKNAHIEARNQKEAAPFLEGPKARMAALDADSNAAKEAAAPMLSLAGDALKEFATPATVSEALEKLAASIKENAAAAQEAIKEQTKAVGEVTPQTSGTAEAKKQLRDMAARAANATKDATQKLSIVKNKCQSLIAAKIEPTAQAIRKYAQTKGKTIEEFFDSLKEGEKIPEAAFCKMLASLEEPLSAELAKLVCRKLEADGVSKDTFMKFVVLYYKVVRTIAFTDDMDITKCKTLRKADEAEVVEVLEGPVTDESNSMTRVRARSTKDDKTEGWITLSGSKGTAFLEKTSKPAVKPAAAAVAAKP